MIYLTGILQFILIIYTTIYEYNKKSSSVFMWAILFVIFGIPHLLYSFHIVEIEYSDRILIIAASFVSIFTVLYLLTRILSTKSTAIYSPLLVIDRNFRMEKILLILLFIIVFTSLYDAYQYSGSLLDTAWGQKRKDPSRETSILSRLLSILKYAAGSIILIYLIYKEKKAKLLLPILLVILYSIISRRRTDLLIIIVPFLAYYILINNRLKIKDILLLLIFGIGAIYIIYAMQIFRYGGSIESFITLYEGNWSFFNSRVIEQIFSGRGELGLQKAFYYFIEKENNYPEFGEGHTYIRMLMFLVPTELSFGLKPPDFAITMGKFWNPYAESGYSMHPTLFGDCYANLGFFGVFLGVFWGLFSNLVDKLNKRRDSTYYPLFLTFSCCFVIIGRGSVYNGFYVMVMVFIIFMLLSKTGFLKNNK